MANGTIILPLSFIAAAADIMMAAELVEQTYPQLQPFVLDNYFRIDTLTNPNPDFKTVKLQDPTRRCICRDDVYRSVYRNRFGEAKTESAITSRH